MWGVTSGGERRKAPLLSHRYLFQSVTWLYTKSYCKRVQFLRDQFLTKKLSVPRGNFSNYFIKILVFGQLYRSKSAILEIAYDMKIDFLLCNLCFPLKQKSAKTIRTYIQIKSDRTLNDFVWNEINCSPWYELKFWSSFSVVSVPRPSDFHYPKSLGCYFQHIFLKYIPKCK